MYRERYGDNIVAKKPDHVAQPNTQAQLAVKDNFRQAAAWAKSALADPQVHAAYLTEARARHSSPNAVAIEDWMNEPEVTAIDLSQYNKHVGDSIYIKAQDDFAVTAAIIVVLAAGVVMTTWQSVLATRAQKEAVANEKQAVAAQTSETKLREQAQELAARQRA